MRKYEWFRWLMMLVLAVIAVYYFLFKTQGPPPPPVPPSGLVTDPILVAAINTQLGRIADAPQKFEPRLRLCMIYDANDLDSIAETCYEQQSKLLEKEPRTWYQLSLLQERMGRTAEAIETMRTAVSNAQANNVALPEWQLGRMLLESGRPDEALIHLKQAQDKLGNQPVLMSAIMRTFIEQGQPEKSIVFADENKLTETPLGPYVNHLLAKAHGDLGNTREQEAALAMADNRTPAMNDTWSLELMRMRYDLPSLKMRITAATRQKQWESGIRLLDELEKFQKPTRETKLQRAACLLQLGSPEESQVIINGLLEESPDDPSLIIALANTQLDIAERRQKLSEAEQALKASEKLLEDDDTNLNAYIVNIRSLAMLDRPIEAINSCRAAWRMNPDQPTTVLMACKLIQQEKLWKENEDLLRPMFQRMPQHPTAGPMLALSLVENGRAEEASLVLDELKHPNLDAQLISQARAALAAAESTSIQE